jgi:hypothetical protein
MKNRIRAFLLLVFALAALATVLPANFSYADGSDPMPLCRGKNCK